MENQPEQQEVNSPSPAEPSTNWAYTPEADGRNPTTPLSAHSVKPVSWTASEFVRHDKSPVWFLGLAGATAVVAGISYLLVQDIVTTIVVVVVAILFGIMANRKPQTLEYHIDNKGITIGSKFYAYASFRSFSVILDNAVAFIQLTPVGRLVPPISVYFPPNQEDEIVETLGSYLPHENRKRDSVDRLMSKIRF